MSCEAREPSCERAIAIAKAIVVLGEIPSPRDFAGTAFALSTELNDLLGNMCGTITKHTDGSISVRHGTRRTVEDSSRG